MNIDRHAQGRLGMGDDALGLRDRAIVTRRHRKSRDGELRFGANQDLQ